ncbi:MAG TPA: hypothetical protein VFJ82_24925 [Longimicrobium sp.]|nr:hypothetical protein [Longimicrobium sp.]
MADRNTPPARLLAAAGQPAYELRADLHAVHGAAGETEGAAPVADVGEARVYPGPGAGGGPVYALSGGSLAVPTGRVYLRFAPGADPHAAEGALRGAGFRIERVPAYAPHTAWVAPVEGDIAGALQRIGALSALPGVEHAEPEMLMERETRG